MAEGQTSGKFLILVDIDRFHIQRLAVVDAVPDIEIDRGHPILAMVSPPVLTLITRKQRDVQIAVFLSDRNCLFVIAI